MSDDIYIPVHSDGSVFTSVRSLIHLIHPASECDQFFPPDPVRRPRLPTVGYLLLAFYSPRFSLYMAPSGFFPAPRTTYRTRPQPKSVSPILTPPERPHLLTTFGFPSILYYSIRFDSEHKKHLKETWGVVETGFPLEQKRPTPKSSRGPYNLGFGTFYGKETVATSSLLLPAHSNNHSRSSVRRLIGGGVSDPNCISSMSETMADSDGIMITVRPIPRVV